MMSRPSLRTQRAYGESFSVANFFANSSDTIASLAMSLPLNSNKLHVNTPKRKPKRRTRRSRNVRGSTVHGTQSLHQAGVIRPAHFITDKLAAGDHLLDFLLGNNLRLPTQLCRDIVGLGKAIEMNRRQRRLLHCAR